MQTKLKDSPYCGVRKEVIQSAKPKLNQENLKHLYDWISERYKVHVRKDVNKEKAPWTDNSIIKNYRFTNVRREHDRETKWLIENITSNTVLSLRDKVLNCIMFRTWNTSTTSEILGAPWREADISKLEDKEKFRSTIEEYSTKNPKYVWFTSAFNCGGLKSAQVFPFLDFYLNSMANKEAKIQTLSGALTVTVREALKLVRDNPFFRILEIDGQSYPKEHLIPEMLIPLRPFHIPFQIKESNLISRLLEADDQQEVFNLLQEIRGVAGFLAQQIQVDLAYIKEFPFSENEFTFAGPGCSRGVDLIFEDRDRMTHTECLFWMRDNQLEVFKKFGYSPKELFTDLEEFDQIMNVSSIENIHCEIQKYIKAITGTGRPRVKYRQQSTMKVKKNLFG